jgi:hypothetical protein
MVAWETASPATLTEIYEGRLQASQDHGHPSSTSVCSISGQAGATSSIFMRLTYDGGSTNYHAGDPYHSTAPRVVGFVYGQSYEQYGITTYTDYTELLGIHITGDDKGFEHAYSILAAGCKAYECIFSGTTNAPIHQYGGGKSSYIRNCLLLYCGGIVHSTGTGSHEMWMYHTSAYHTGWKGGGQYMELTRNHVDSSSSAPFKLHAKNCYFDATENQVKVTNSDLWGTEKGQATYYMDYTDSTHNASSDGTAHNASIVLTKESFEGTGYEQDEWTESVGASSSIDEDQATSGVTGAPGDWDAQCCKMVYASGEDCNIQDEYGLYATVEYARCDFIVDTDSLGNNESNRIFTMSASTGNPVRAAVGRDGSGTLRLEVTIDHDAAGGSTWYQNISQDTRYRFEAKWDTVTDTYEWKLDGTSKNSGSLTGGAVDDALRYTYVGTFAGSTDAAMTIYFDNIWTRKDQYPYGTDMDVWRLNVTRDITTDPTVVTFGEDTGKDYQPDSVTHDCFWYEGSPDANYNTQGLLLDLTTDNLDEKFGVRWGMSNLPALTIRHGQLLFKHYGGEGAANTMRDVYGVRAESSWDETTVTWNSPPTPGVRFCHGNLRWYTSAQGWSPLTCHAGHLDEEIYTDGELNIYLEPIGSVNTRSDYRDGEYSTAADRPYLLLHTGTPDWDLPSSQTNLYQWGADLSSDSDMAVTTDITGATRYNNSCGCFDGPVLTGEVAEAVSFRSGVDFQIAYPTSDQNEVGTWTHATTSTLYEAIDDVLGVDDADVIDSP